MANLQSRDQALFKTNNVHLILYCMDDHKWMVISIDHHWKRLDQESCDHLCNIIVDAILTRKIDHNSNCNMDSKNIIYKEKIG